MNDDELLQTFRREYGDQLAAKFVQAFYGRQPGQDRLRYWQQEQWYQFCERHSAAAKFSFPELESAFRICHVHWRRLKPDIVPATFGYWAFPRNYLDARLSSFPFANFIYCGDSVEMSRDRERQVFYCDDCRAALIGWNRGRKNKIGLPDQLG